MIKKSVFIFVFFLFFIQPIQSSVQKIEGEEVVEIAQQGESFAFYEADGFSFSLAQEKEGVSISETGKLVVRAHAKEGSVLIIASANGNVLEKNIQLIESWTKKSENGKRFAIPSSDSARRIIVQQPKALILLFQKILFGAVVLFVLVYVWLRRTGGRK